MVLLSREWLALVATSLVALSAAVVAPGAPAVAAPNQHPPSLKDRIRVGGVVRTSSSSHGQDAHLPAAVEGLLPRSRAVEYSDTVSTLLTSGTAKAGDLIPNQYIIVFKNHVDKHTAAMHMSWLTSLFVPNAFTSRPDSPFVAQDRDSSSITAVPGFADEFHIIRNWFVDGFKGYAARLPEIVAKSLQKLPEIAFIEQDQIVTVLATQKNPPSWGLTRIGTRKNGATDYVYPDSAGEGVDAYIVDTGVTISHKDFGGRAKVGASFSTDKNDRDGNGHGTHVAGTVGGTTYGVAKKAKIIAVKVLNAQGSGTNSDVISGIEWVATEAPKRSKKAVGNMSLGGGASAALDAAVRSAIDAGIMFAVAAGNSAGDACKLSPARVREALTVAASDKNDKLASFSEKGKCVDLIAPGVDITSSWNNGRENTISGTSMASPHGCGVLALALAEQNFTTPKQYKDYVVNIGTRKTVSGVPANTPNILLFADVTSEPQEPLPEEPEDPNPEDPEEPGGVCPFPQCLFDPSCTSCCFEGVDC
ncbi:peptidase S8/S53 domain-containing protein [Zopfochytrium polystomum]|nr:peptidase S8/S53 domain-containing protein [Zopfochytrium polystomum]